jgi:predicted RNA-binding protein with PUA-like domain
MRAIPELADMALLQKGSRLSITPVSKGEWDKIVSLVRDGAAASTGKDA